VPSEVLFGVFAAKRKASRPSLVYCGDDERAKAVAVELIRDVGFDPVDAGLLRVARYTEPFTLLIANSRTRATEVRSSRTASSGSRRRDSYLLHGGCTPTERAYAISCPRCSCWSPVIPNAASASVLFRGA